jgi:hypothetical protein
MRPLSEKLCPARHRIGPAAWSPPEPSQRNHLLSFMKVQAVHELCSEPRAPASAAARRPLQRPRARQQCREPVVGAQVEAVVSLVGDPANHREPNTVDKDVVTIKYGNTTGH